MSDLTISPLDEHEFSEAARVLSVAMLSNPLHVAVFQGQGQEARRELVHMFESLMGRLPGFLFQARLDGHMVGVLRMKWCPARQPSGAGADEKIPQAAAPQSTALGNTASRVAHWHAVWDHYHPLQPHWHLGPLGVLPPHQGSGFGTALMDRFCHEVDARKAAAYLETDLTSNVRLYQKFGFQVVEEADILGVRNRFMWRSPRT